MRLITLNVNGLRAAAIKGLFEWLARQRADVVCLQEIRLQEEQLSPALRAVGGLQGHFYCAGRKGYSGVAVYSRRPPDRLLRGFGSEEHDDEGRYLQADFGGLSVVSLYLPSGSAGEHRQQSKYRFMDHFLPVLQRLCADGREYVLCGDWNIAHTERDLRNWQSNQKNSGFLPGERAWIGRVLGELGWVDVYRALRPEATDEGYTWWSNRGQAWAKNVGWRIDYQIATPGVARRATRERIYKERCFSDHAPLIVDYEYDL